MAVQIMWIVAVINRLTNAQNVPQYIFYNLMHSINHGEKYPKNVGYFCNLQKTATLKQSPIM
jgi:hypothetical protein